MPLSNTDRSSDGSSSSDSDGSSSSDSDGSSSSSLDRSFSSESDTDGSTCTEKDRLSPFTYESLPREISTLPDVAGTNENQIEKDDNVDPLQINLLNSDQSLAVWESTSSSNYVSVEKEQGKSYAFQYDVK